MAASTTVFSTAPTAGIALGWKGSTAPGNIAALTKVNGSNGHVFILVKASETLGSVDTIKIGTAGSASSDSGSAGWTLNAPSGLTTGQFGWAQRTTLA